MMVGFFVATAMTFAWQPQDTTPIEAEAPAEAEAPEVEEPEEPVVCRSRLVPSERVGQRFRRVSECKTQAEWDAERRRPRR